MGILYKFYFPELICMYIFVVILQYGNGEKNKTCLAMGKINITQMLHQVVYDCFEYKDVAFWF